LTNSFNYIGDKMTDHKLRQDVNMINESIPKKDNYELRYDGERKMHDSVPHCQIIKKQIPLQKGKIFLLP
jgi:hypothetical protein